VRVEEGLWAAGSEEAEGAVGSASSPLGVRAKSYSGPFAFPVCCHSSVPSYTPRMLGVFDSGSGGLSVVRAIRAVAPHADLVYFGDLKNAPYGNKSREELGALTVLGIEKLMVEGAREIVSACNSVSVSIALPMFEILELPRASLIEMVGPTMASFRARGARVAVVATRATIESGMYQNGLRAVGNDVVGVAIPELVALIERGAPREAMEALVRNALSPLGGGGHTHLLLGCTHFPLVKDVFVRVAGECLPGAAVVDPAEVVATTVAERFNTTGAGRTTYLLSRDSAVFRAYAHAVGGAYTVALV